MSPGYAIVSDAFGQSLVSELLKLFLWVLHRNGYSLSYGSGPEKRPPSDQERDQAQTQPQERGKDMMENTVCFKK